MWKSYLKIQPDGDAPVSRIRIACLVTGVIWTILLPACLPEEAHHTFYTDKASGSVLMNAVTFYSGHAEKHKQAPNPDRYIAVIPYIGIEARDDERDSTTSKEILRDHNLPPFEESRWLECNNYETGNLPLFHMSACRRRGDCIVRIFCL